MAEEPSPIVIEGSLDTGGSTASIALIGKWAFWPNQFIDPFAIHDTFTRFESFPSSWSVYKPELFPLQGYASYALTITGLDPSVEYGFRFPAYSCAATYYIDGKKLYSQGTPANSRKSEKPFWDTNLIPMPITGVTHITLVLHLSNFNDIYSASSVPISFGAFEVLRQESTLNRILMIIPFGAILAMGAYFLSLFVFHHEESSSFWLGLLCLVFALRIVCYDEFILLDIFPFISPDIVFRLGYLTFSLASAGFCGFVRSQYPQIAKRWVIYLATIISLLYGFFNMVLTVSFFTALLVPFQIFTLLTAVYLLYVIIRAAFKHIDGAPTFLIGFLIFVLVVVRDILIANRVIEGVFLAHFGILGIIAAMGLIVVRRFSHAFSNVEAVAKNLEKINTSLVRFVPNEFLTFLGKKSITEICLGDNIRQDMCVMFIYLGIEMSLDGAASRLNMLEMFNHTLLLVNPIIQKYNGFVDKYLAEGILVLFPDDPRNAVLCALEIQSVLENYNIRRDAQSLPHIQYAAGIHRGSLMIGTIGEDERMDSTVVSDVVNISSRLQKFAVSKKITVMISAEVAIPLGGADPCQCILVPHGEVRLRGKDLMVSLFEVRRK